MRGIFLCEKNDKTFTVYDEKTVFELQKLMNIEIYKLAVSQLQNVVM